MSSYADTSFLVSLYTYDRNTSLAIHELLHRELPFFLTSFGEFEFNNALRLKVFRDEISRRQMNASLKLFKKDVSSGIYFLTSMTEGAWSAAGRLSTKHTPHLGTRALDVMHVASAIELKAKTFLTFDARQRLLAQKAGLTTRAF